MVKPSFKIKGIKKNLTLPILKMDIGVTVYVKIVEPVVQGKEIKQKEGEAKKGPAMLLNVINLETGELCQIVANRVLVSVLTEEYPNNGYVGLFFQLTKLAKKSGKDYNPFQIQEIEIDESYDTSK